MYRISQEKIISLDNANGVTTVEAAIIVSSSEALPAYNEIPGRILVPGSAAIVPSEATFFMLDFDNTWKEWSDS